MTREISQKLAVSCLRQGHASKEIWLLQIVFLFLSLIGWEALAFVTLPMSEEYQALNGIIIDEKRSNEEKIEAIEAYFKKEPRCNKALQWIGRVDKDLAVKLMREAFHDKNRTVNDRVELGEWMLSRGFFYTPDFIDEYAPFLINEILSSGTRTFNTKLDEHTKTAIGQYAYIASGFMGYSSEHFERISDKRVIGILIKAMDAPDRVYGEQLGCCIRGKVGESTGRNVERQQIPVALAKLGAKEAIEPLRQVLRKHHDWYLRDNAAYALGILLSPQERASVIHRLKKSKKHRFHLFAFGKGLIHRGDDAGVEFMDFKYSTYYDKKSLSEVVYMAMERANIVRNLRSSRLEEFYRQAFNHKPFYNIFLFDETKVHPNDYGHTKYTLDKASERIVGLYNKILTSIEVNQLENLAPIIKDIADSTADSSIRMRSQQFLEKLDTPKTGPDNIDSRL